MSDLVKHSGINYEHCYKCCLQLTPDLETTDGHCPRCGYDLTIIDIGQELATEQQLKQRQAVREMMDLQIMLGNWAGAFINQTKEKGVDWSLPHEFLEEVWNHMMPWMTRLVQSEYFGKEEVAETMAAFDHEMGKLVRELDQEESILRLTGQWSDSDQEIKDYWESMLQKSHGISFSKYLQLPMRNE